MDGLRSAMSAAGLTLGQANVSGGGAQSQGQNPPPNAPAPARLAFTPLTATDEGVRAYA
jgi:hypothetical protein